MTATTLEDRMERLERLVGVLAYERAYAAPNPGGRVREGYPKNPSQYADPEDKAYPLDTRKRVKNAAARFAQFKDRYSPEKRAEILRRIDAAKKRLHIGEYRKAQSAAAGTEGSPPSAQGDSVLSVNAEEAVRDGLAEVLDILREVITDNGDEAGADEELREAIRLLASEEHSSPDAAQNVARNLADTFSREVREHGFGRS